MYYRQPTLIHFTTWQQKQKPHKLKLTQQNQKEKDQECIVRKKFQNLKIAKTIKKHIADKEKNKIK